MLVGGKSHCYTFCFSAEGSCASAHTLACELVFPVKWVRVPQEGRLMYFRAMCQHLWKKKYNVLYWYVSHMYTHSLILTQEISQLISSRGGIWTQAWRTHWGGFCIAGKTGVSGLSVGLSKGLELDLNSVLTTYWLYDCGQIFYTLCYSLIHKVKLDGDLHGIKSLWGLKSSCIYQAISTGHSTEWALGELWVKPAIQQWPWELSAKSVDATFFWSYILSLKKCSSLHPHYMETYLFYEKHRHALSL